MRAFICLPIPQRVRDEIGRIADEVRGATSMRARWVPKANYHVTVQFLGDIDPMMCVDLERIARKIGRCVDPFDLRLDRAGAFPSPARARVLWVGGDGPPPYRGLLTSMHHELERLGFPGERADGLAHVTIARIKGRPDPTLDRWIDRASIPEPLRVPVDRIVLMQSELTPAGARYAPLFEVPLVGRPAAEAEGDPADAV